MKKDIKKTLEELQSNESLMNDLQDMFKEMEEEDRKISEPVDKIIEILSGFGYGEKRKIATELGRKLIGDEGGLDNFILENCAKHLYKQISFIAKEQRQNGYVDPTFGDIDSSFNLISENEKRDVYTIKDNCGGGDVYWLVVIDNVSKTLHVRTLVEESESNYPNGKYPSKLGLKVL